MPSGVSRKTASKSSAGARKAAGTRSRTRKPAPKVLAGPPLAARRDPRSAVLLQLAVDLLRRRIERRLGEALGAPVRGEIEELAAHRVGGGERRIADEESQMKMSGSEVRACRRTSGVWKICTKGIVSTCRAIEGCAARHESMSGLTCPSGQPIHTTRRVAAWLRAGRASAVAAARPSGERRSRLQRSRVTGR